MSAVMTPLAIGFLGAGQMATALAKGWTQAGLLDVATSIASDPYEAARDRFTQATRIRSTTSNVDVVTASTVVVLAVKPQTIHAVLSEIRSHLTPNHVVISIAAGVTLAQLSHALGSETRLIRVMPNTPCLLGESASGFAVGSAATPADAALVAKLFSSVGQAFAVAEHLLNAVTGLSGSGPAYVYVMIEALADGGVRMGLPRDVALKLAAQTVLGSAKMSWKRECTPVPSRTR